MIMRPVWIPTPKDAEEPKLESKLESKVRDFLNDFGDICVQFKATSPSNRGIADRVVLYKGIYIAMELKVGKNKPSALQQDFLEKVRKAGGVAGIVRSIADVKELLNEAEALLLGRKV